MEERLLADKYAKALISVAEEKESIERLEKELAVLSALLEKKPQLQKILHSPIIGLQEKTDLLEGIIRQRHISPQLREFLLLLLKMGRFNLFSQIHQIYKDLIYSMRRRLKIFVESAFTFNASQKMALKEKLIKIYKRNIDLSVRVNPALIGGARVYIGHTLFDGTVRHQLKVLRDRLWKE